MHRTKCFKGAVKDEKKLKKRKKKKTTSIVLVSLSVTVAPVHCGLLFCVCSRMKGGILKAVNAIELKKERKKE